MYRALLSLISKIKFKLRRESNELKNYKIGSIILLIFLSIIVWIVSGMFFSFINRWINYPIAIIVFIVGLMYINKYYD